MTVSEWANTVWTLLNVRPKTLYDYKRLYLRHLDPIIGNCEIDSIDVLAVQKKLLDLQPQTARHTLMVLKVIWREALKYEITNLNRIAQLRTPSIQVKDRKFLKWEEVDSLDWGRYNKQIRFLALHGLRWSEAVALRDEDIRDGFVAISRSIYGDVKSKTSVRKVPYIGYWAKFPITYKPLRLAANLHGVTVHSFRRTYAYLLKTKGIHVTTAQKLLGHADPIITLKIYTSVLDDEIDATGVILRQSIKESSELM